MVHVDGAFARSLNTWKAPPVGRLLKFQCFKAIGRDYATEWAYIDYGNAKVWVHRNDVRVKDGADLTSLKPLMPADLIAPTPAAVANTGVPQVSKAIKALYKNAVESGRAGDVVTIIGDCNSEPPVFFGRVAAGMVNLEGNPELAAVAAYFGPAFRRTSQATHGSFSSAMAFDAAWSDPAKCQANEGPLVCELRLSNASIVVIALGTGDTFDWQSFEKNYRLIIEHAMKNNVVPLLMTKADALESAQGGAPADYINATVRKLGLEYGVPVIDFAAAVRALPNGGLVDERNTDGAVIDPFHINELAMDTRMVMTLQTLAQVSDAGAAAKKTPRAVIRRTPAPRGTAAPKPTAKP